MWCACIIPYTYPTYPYNIHTYLYIFIQLYILYVDGMASPCQALAGTVDLSLSGGEATVTAPEKTKPASLCRMEEVYDDLWMGLTSGRAASSTGQPMAKSKGASSGRGSVFCKSGHKLLLQKNNSHFAQEPSTADCGSVAKVLVQFCMVLCMSINCYHGLKPLRDCGSCQ